MEVLKSMKKPFSIWLAVTVLYLGICAPFFIVRTVDLIKTSAEHNRFKKIHDDWLLSTDAIKYRQTDAIEYQQKQQSANKTNNPFAFLNNYFFDNSAEINNDVDNEAWVKAGAKISNYANWYESTVNYDHDCLTNQGIICYAYFLLSAVYWIIVWGFARKREKPISND